MFYPKRCGFCKYWKTAKEAPEQWTRSYNATDVCMPREIETGKEMEMPFEVRLCTHPKLSFFERPVESDGFSVVDGSEYFAALATAEDFGCIHHEGRAGEPIMQMLRRSFERVQERTKRRKAAIAQQIVRYVENK